jgi:hypothetical protein
MAHRPEGKKDVKAKKALASVQEAVGVEESD